VVRPSDPNVPDLNAANAGDRMWVWDWRASANLAPIAAETGALWLLETSRGAEPTVYVF
jgi:hypothetical protein